jgi:MFS transporter, DHA2 family, multidrug resistance protein
MGPADSNAVTATTTILAKAGRREWIGLGVIALPCLLYSMDLTVLNLATPHISADLKPSSAQLLWIVDIYGFLMAGSLITMGTLGDRIGRRRLLLIGAAAFGFASMLAAFSTSTWMLIAARALLGIASATLAPSTLSLIRNMFHDPGQRTAAIGVWIASFSAGGALGPLFGGLMLEHFWWGSVFLVNVPIMILLLVLGPHLLPEFRDPNAGRLDLASAALSLVAVLVTIYGLKRTAESGVEWASTLAIIAGLGVGAIFLHRQRRLADPLIDLRLFRFPAFSAALATNTFSFFIAFAAFLFIAQYLQLVVGMGPLQAGLWTAPSGAAFIVGSTLAPRLVRRMRPASLMAGGLGLAALSFAALTQVGGPHQLALLVSAYVLLSLGLAPVFTLTTDLIVGSVPPERAGVASGLAETSSEFGGALGIAILGSVLTAIYRGGMADAVPGDTSPELAEAIRSTLGSTLALAEHLPGATGAHLVEAGRAAFTQAFKVTAVICAAVALTTAMLAAILLRRAGTQPEGGGQSDVELNGASGSRATEMHPATTVPKAC